MRRRLATLVLGLAALALLALASTAAAQSALAARVEVNVTFPVEPLMPKVDAPGFPPQEDVRLRLPVRVTYVVPAGAVTAFPNSTVQLETTQAPIWLTVSILPSNLTFPVGVGPVLAERRFEHEAVALVYAKASAPALTMGALEIVATAERNGLLAGASDTAEGMVQARPYVVLQASASNVTLALRPYGSADVDLALANTGNALVAATVAVAHAAPGLEVEVPRAAVVLRPNPLAYQVEREARLLTVTVTHRGGDGGEAILLVTPALRDASWLVEERVVRLHVDLLRSPQPAAVVPLAVLGLAGVAALLARRA